MSSIILGICAFVVIILVKLLKSYAARQAFLKKINRIPGPKPLPVFGNGLDFNSSADLLPVMLKYTKEYGLSYQLHLGPDTYVITSDPKLIEFITTSNTQVKKSVSYRFLFNWLGTGLLTAGNPKWKSHRRILTPTFHFKILEDCVPIFHANAQNLIAHWKKSLDKNVDIYEDIVLCTLDVICEAAMGIPINALKDGKSSDYVESVKYMGKMVVDRTFSIWRQLDFLYKNSPDYKREKRCVDYLHNVTDQVIKTKRQELKNKKDNEKNDVANEDDKDNLYIKKRFAFLDMLLRCSTEEGGTLSDYDIRQEVDTFMFAGHDTVSSAISFTMYLLATHPEIQEKVYEEIKTVFGLGTNENRKVTMEKLNELKYLEMVIKESLRMFPPVPMVARELTEDINFNGQILPAGLVITMLSYGVHRIPEIYEDPETFNPERFSTENCASRSIFAFIPFSAGPRNCIGQKFALLEMKSLISSLLQEFKFVQIDDFQILPVAETVLKSQNGIKVQIQQRQTNIKK